MKIIHFYPIEKPRYSQQIPGIIPKCFSPILRYDDGGYLSMYMGIIFLESSIGDSIMHILCLLPYLNDLSGWFHSTSKLGTK